ncbi:hypothetical protein BGZ76_005849, partial [Entomortierella beljakovae]
RICLFVFKESTNFEESKILQTDDIFGRLMELRKNLDDTKKPIVMTLSPVRNGFMTLSKLQLMNSISNSYCEMVENALKLDQMSQERKVALYKYKFVLDNMSPGEFLSIFELSSSSSQVPMPMLSTHLRSAMHSIHRDIPNG